MTTMLDIANRAGVSRSTVSFVLNGKHLEMGVNEETRQRVLQVAGEMGYRRNGLARAIATGKAPIFGFLVRDSHLDSEVVARVLRGVMDEAENCRHIVQILRLTGEDDEDIILRCVEMRPAGVVSIYVAPDILSHLQQEMACFHIPVVALDSTPPLAGGSRIYSDDREGCRQAIAHLVALGHERIAFIGGDPRSVASNLRDEGYHKAMAEHNLPILPGYREMGYWENQLIDAATHRLFCDLAVPPTAVFCADDRTAMVACRTLRRLGLRVPEDVSLVGFANLTMAEFNDPPLTTVVQPFRQMGRRAVLRLLAAAEEQDHDPSASYEERLPTYLNVRQSTARLAR